VSFYDAVGARGSFFKERLGFNSHDDKVPYRLALQPTAPHSIWFKCTWFLGNYCWLHSSSQSAVTCHSSTVTLTVLWLLECRSFETLNGTCMGIYNLWSGCSMKTTSNKNCSLGLHFWIPQRDIQDIIHTQNCGTVPGQYQTGACRTVQMTHQNGRKLHKENEKLESSFHIALGHGLTYLDGY
jgi:hypothetical protein